MDEKLDSAMVSTKIYYMEENKMKKNIQRFIMKITASTDTIMIPSKLKEFILMRKHSKSKLLQQLD